MINSSGIWCDVCKNPILFGEYEKFKISGSRMLHSCSECSPRVHEFKTAYRQGDLPRAKDIGKQLAAVYTEYHRILRDGEQG